MRAIVPIIAAVVTGSLVYIIFRAGAQGDRELTDFLIGSQVLFRVKVVDHTAKHGVILAEADQISSEDNREGAKLSLLPVDPCDLGDIVWRVNFDEGRPVLEINNSLSSTENISDLVRDDAYFFALAFPAILREILVNYIITQECDVDSDDEWCRYWIQFAQGLNSEELPGVQGDSEGKSVWIDTAIQNFSRKMNLLQRYMIALQRNK